MRAFVTATLFSLTHAQDERNTISKFTPYYVDENSTDPKYQAQIDDVSLFYAKEISPTNPMECFGENFEVFDQLESPEWQICRTSFKEHPRTGKAFVPALPEGE